MIPLTPLTLLITTGLADHSNFSIHKTEILKTIQLAVAAEIAIIQIREKRLSARLLFDLVRDAVILTARSKTKLLVNERFDIALAAGADGVHLTSTSMPTDSVRNAVPSGLVIGVSTHTQAEVVAAKEARADYAMLGPIFETPGKGDPVGVDSLRQICLAVAPFPVVAVGGIDASNEAAVIDAGAAGVAAIRYLNNFVRIGK